MNVDPVSRRINAAAAAGRVGAVIRLARRAQGLTQAELGSLCGMSQSAISRIERNGPASDNVHYLRVLADVLGLEPRFVGLAHPPHATESKSAWAGATHHPVSTRHPGRPVGQVSEHDQLIDAVHDPVVGTWNSAERLAEDVSTFTAADFVLDRRRFTTSIATLMVGSRLLRPINSVAVSAPADAVPVLDGQHVEIEQIELAVAALSNWEKRFTLGIKRKAVVGQLNEVAALATESRMRSVRTRLMRAVAQLSKIAGSMSWDAGLEPEAQRYYMLAFRAAHAADDRQLGIDVLGAVARQMLYLNRPGDAIEIVRQAHVLESNPTPGSAAMLKLREGWAHALLGHPEALHRAIGEAEHLHTSALSLAPGVRPRIDRAEIFGTAGGRFLELTHVTGDRRHAQTAASHLERALALRAPIRLKNRALDLINLARARLLTDAPDDIDRLVGEAVAVARGASSARVDDKLGRLAQEIRRSEFTCTRDAFAMLSQYLKLTTRTGGVPHQ